MSLTAKLYNQEGEEAGVLDLPEDVFGVSANPDLIHQALVAQLANARVAIAHTKDRSEVSGGGRKPWRQKGTGRARHGSSRSPLWIGGGVTFGPRKNRNYSKSLPKKMKQKAILGVLGGKFRDEEIIFLDKLILEKPKTKAAGLILNKLLSALQSSGRSSHLFLVDSKNKGIWRSFRNLAGTKIIPPSNLNVRDLLTFRYVFLPQESIKELKKTFASGPRTKN